MTSRVLLGLVIALGMTGCEQGFDLLTPAEYAEIADLPDDGETVRAIPAPDAPMIDVVKPGTNVVETPFDIEIRFRPAEGAEIVPESARVTYVKGIFRKNITNLIRDHATVDASGIFGQGAKIPPGKHRLLVEVTDSKGRLGETELRVRILK